MKDLLWIDTKSTIGLFAVNDANYIVDTDCAFGIGSNRITSKEIPSAFWKEFRPFREGALKLQPLVDDQKDCIVFIGKNGISEKVTLPPQ
jgi:hypothetical protein